VTQVLYLDTSAALRPLLEPDSSPGFADRIATASTLITSRLTLVEAARALVRLRLAARTPEERLADAGRSLAALWARCEIWELTPPVCDLAATLAPGNVVRTLDALHLATYLLARRHI